MEGQMKTILDWCLEHWAVTAFLITCVIQVTPIFKVNPITALFQWIGKQIVADVMQEITALKATQEALGEQIDENEKDRIRFEVLDFANSCRHGRKHTKDEFEHIIVLNEKYHKLLQKTGDENGVFSAEYEFIFEIYQHCQRENKFL